jgi:hypothetical protein
MNIADDIGRKGLDEVASKAAGILAECGERVICGPRRDICGIGNQTIELARSDSRGGFNGLLVVPLVLSDESGTSCHTSNDW